MKFIEVNLLGTIKIDSLFKFILLLWCISIPFKNAFYQISTFLIVLFFLINILKRENVTKLKQLLNKYKEIVIALFLIFLSMTLSNLLNNTEETKAWHLEIMFFLRYVLVCIILIYFHYKSFFTKKDLFLFLFVSLLIQGFDGIYQAIYGNDFFKSNIGNIYEGLTGITFNKNIFGFIMGFALLFMIVFFKKYYILKKHSYMYYIVLSIFIFNIVFSYSRTIWLATFVSLLFFIFFNKNIVKKNNIIIILFFFTIFTILVFYIPTLEKRLMLLFNGFSSARDLIWQESIILIKEQLIFGYGIDNWKNYGIKEYASVHNSLLEILFSLGLFGLVVFSYMLILTIKEIYITKKLDLYIVLVYFFISSQFDHSILTSKIYLSFLIIFMFYVFSNRIESIKKE